MSGREANRDSTVLGGGGLTVSENLGESEWDAFVAEAGGRLAQTVGWGDVKGSQGWQPHRIGVRGDGRILAGAQILVRRYPPLGSIGYLDGGPLTVSADVSVSSSVLDAMDRACRRFRIRALAVDPPPGHESLVKTMMARGYGPAQVKTALAATVQIDLTREEDEIMARMKSKTRHNVRRGIRSGINVERLGREGIDTFMRILGATALRQGFVPPERSYFAGLFERLAPLDRVHLFIADFEGEPMSAILLTAFGDRVVYKRGGWDGSHGDKRPNDVLHWRAIQWARSAGFARYDFDGIEPDIARLVIEGGDLPRMENVTRFKLGFGGDVVLLPESLSYVPNRLVRFGYDRIYPMVRRSRMVKRTIKRLRAR